MKRIILQSFVFALTISSLAINYVAIGLIANAEYRHPGDLHNVMRNGTLYTFWELFLTCFIPTFILCMTYKFCHYKTASKIKFRQCRNLLHFVIKV